jgi:hypothetical protein
MMRIQPLFATDGVRRIGVVHHAHDMRERRPPRSIGAMVPDGVLADGDLVPAREQAGPRVVGELRERHAHRVLAAGDQVRLERVELGVDGGRDELHDPDVPAGIVVGELRPQRPHDGVERRLGRAVVGAPRDRHDRQTRRHRHERGRPRGPGLEVRQERRDERDVRGVVRRQLVLHEREVDGLGVGKVDRLLHAGVQDDAVDFGMGLGYTAVTILC